MDTKAMCSCPPGFNFVDPDNKFHGCDRNFTRQSCARNKKENIRYPMFNVENTAWLDDPYAFYRSMTKDDCRDACLQDSNCEAALYIDGKCIKQKLPLSFGRTNILGTTPTTAFIKVGSFIGFAIFYFLVYRRHRLRYEAINNQPNISLTEGVSLRSFSYVEIEKATECFKEEMGKGAFGTVFKGSLSNTFIAVKRLDNMVEDSQTKQRPSLESRVQGEYVAPEWHRNMPITVKADVYSFGVVLLEIICCRKNVEREAPEDEIILSDWVYDCFKAGQITKLIIEEEVDVSILERMMMIGLWCIQDEPSLRPSMKKVVLMLEGIVDIPVPPINSFFSS
ncbi:G-type lectin S-receptor-like serine/threonine-protein kinase LECRK1 [Cinnamomum micranthum f. kanehirae]|uniref:G-type lectin S-receptor-like serine/threonine-protein kinase LECRK1 n=1 Tax=Cinnamomum micranthum f. kanehirae TaxID=337451 RepID=A0A3S3PY12_9MAGN|nr:G-type lectin S-receptor-like serine/threonine-protein kinase LECRK1 [Cinnamomum micranthum f. kanehirae]